MADLCLSFAMNPYDRIIPLITGEVKPDGITLEYGGNPGGVPRLFYEQEKFQRYDISEMSMSTYLRMRSIKWPYRLLPVFHNRAFSYTNIHIRKSSGIRPGHPDDLKGKRMGLPDYQMTAALWMRGVLQMEFGVKPEDIIWYQERGEHFSHTGAAAQLGLAIPSRITLNFSEKGFNVMMRDKELDASAGSVGVRAIASAIERVREALPENRDVVPLFSDPEKEGLRFFKKYGVYPPHHGTAVRESILDEHPWVAISLMEAFEESKRIAIDRLHHPKGNRPNSLIVFEDRHLRQMDAVFGTDPFPYGIKANAKAIDMIQTFSFQQELTKRKQPLDEIFPQEVIYREERL